VNDRLPDECEGDALSFEELDETLPLERDALPDELQERVGVQDRVELNDIVQVLVLLGENVTSFVNDCDMLSLGVAWLRLCETLSVLAEAVMVLPVGE
jgi:hypothetical protein